MRPYRLDDAETAVIALGSVLGTIKDVIDERREQGERIGVLGITSFRPFPLEAVREALAKVTRFVVVEKAFSAGIGGIVDSHVRMALRGGTVPSNYTVIAGLGGRPVLRTSLHSMLDEAVADRLEPLSFLDLNHDLVDAELARQRADVRSGPMAENLLRDLGTVRSDPH